MEGDWRIKQSFSSKRLVCQEVSAQLMGSKEEHHHAVFDLLMSIDTGLKDFFFLMELEGINAVSKQACCLFSLVDIK